MTNTFEVTIKTMGARGDGVGTQDGLPVYVPMALPGDRATVCVRERKKNGLYADLVSIEEDSAMRGAPACVHFGRCGGCQLQHLNSEAYAQWVQDRAMLALNQHGFENIPIKQAVIASPASRRRVALKALNTAAGLILGFNEAGSHQIVNLNECPVMAPSLQTLLPSLRILLGSLLPARKLATVHLTDTDSGLDMLVEASSTIDLGAREKLAEFADKHDIAALHWSFEGQLDPVSIRREPVMKHAGVKVPLPPAAFIQASIGCERSMVDAVVSACEGTRRVADLFCGIGTFTFPLAVDHQVLAIEGAQESLAALEVGRNMASANGVQLKQIVSKHRDLFRRPLSVKELAAFGAVVIDPPRAGAQAQMVEIANSTVENVVSISCNPNTFARDARILADGGFTIESVLPVDQFLWSTHLELVGVFRR